MKENHTGYGKYFQGLPKSEFRLFEQYSQVRTFEKGKCIISPGKTQKELYIVISGVVMSYLENPDRIHVIAFFFPTCVCVVPESFYQQLPSRYSLKCLTKSEMRCISFENLFALYNQSQAIERLFRRMVEIRLSAMINRHIELHTLSIEGRFRAFCKRNAELLHVVPHKYLASYLAIDPTNFSKLFNKVKI